MKSSPLVLACLLLTGACSKVSELDRRTESVERSTEKVSADTKEMNKTTGIMHQHIRSATALTTRKSPQWQLI
jgi:hypothetical protein